MNIKHKPSQGIHLAKNQHGTLALDPNAGFYCVSFPAVDVEMSSVMFCSSNLSTRCPNSFHFSQLAKSPLWQAHMAALKPIKCFSCPLPSYDPSPQAPHCCALLGGMGKRVAWETNMPKPLIPSSNYYYSIPSSHLCLLMTLEISCLLTNYSLIQVILRSALAISYSSIMLRLLHAAKISKVLWGTSQGQGMTDRIKGRATIGRLRSAICHWEHFSQAPDAAPIGGDKPRQSG